MKSAVYSQRITGIVLCWMLLTGCSPATTGQTPTTGISFLTTQAQASGGKDPQASLQTTTEIPSAIQTQTVPDTQPLTTPGSQPATTPATTTPVTKPSDYASNVEIKLPGSFSAPASTEHKQIANSILFSKLGIKPGSFWGNLGSIRPGQTNATSHSLFALTLADKDLPALSTLGRGYDIFSYYAMRGCVKETEILDFERLLADGKLFRDDVKHSDYRMVSSENARSYSREVAKSIGIEGNYLFFSGSTKASFTSTHLEQTSSYFGTIFYDISRYKIYIDPMTDLKNYVNPAFLAYMEQTDPLTVFREKGTHVLRSIRVGGRLNYNIAIEKRFVSDKEDFEIKAKAKFNAGFASLGMDYEGSTSTVSEEFSEHIDESIMTFGGNGVDGLSMKYDPAVLKNWRDSVASEPDLCDFEDGGLVPIWEFAPTSALREKYQKAYVEYANQHLTVVPSEMTVSALRLVFLQQNQTPSDKIPDPAGNWHLIGNIAGRTVHPFDGLAYLYARYHREDDPSNPPVVEILFENETQGEDARAWFESHYANDPEARLYGWNGTDNIEGSELGRTINTPGAEKGGAHRIRLYYVTSPKGPGIRDLVIRHIGPNAQTYYSKTVSSPETLEEIFDQTSMAQNQPVAQDIAEGAKSTVLLDQFPYIIYRNVYLEWIR